VDGPGDSLAEAYEALMARYGAQRWWPGDSRFEIMVGAVLTQNTAWINVERAIANLKRDAALEPEAILALTPKRLAARLRPAGYFNIKARRLRALCEWLVDRGGVKALRRRSTAGLRRELLAVHGIGPETADSILLYALDRPVFVIDAYTRRIFRRLGLIDGDEPYEDLRRLFESAVHGGVKRCNEYHALIVAHAKAACRARPRCEDCVLASGCGRVGV
jgi:endonuclease-3 related protein